MRGIGLVGCGAIGSIIAKAIDEGKVNARLLYVYDIKRDFALKLAGELVHKPKVIDNIEGMLRDREVEVIVEAASDEAIRKYLDQIIEAGKEVLVMSIGGLLYPETRKVYEENSGRIHVPAGAIAGLDAVQAISIVGVDKVVLTTRKPPQALSYSEYVKKRKIDLEKINEPVLIYEGPVEEAMRLFPKSVNVAAALALYSNTGVLVRIIADPARERILHEIVVESKVSNLKIIVENVPHPDNPRTSYLAALSCIQKLREICR
ncbi:MAG: aspartate dehydrogenase [Thermoproteota archaeon]